MPTLWGLLEFSLFLLVDYIMDFSFLSMTFAPLSILSEIRALQKRVFKMLKFMVS